jgi:hypothetical protein
MVHEFTRQWHCDRWGLVDDVHLGILMSARHALSCPHADPSPLENAMTTPTNTPMGRLDAIEIGERKLTIQTEFFEKPHWRIEIKVYLGGALKKVYNEDLSGVTEERLQATINELHHARLAQIREDLMRRAR